MPRATHRRARTGAPACRRPAVGARCLRENNPDNHDPTCRVNPRTKRCRAAVPKRRTKQAAAGETSKRRPRLGPVTGTQLRLVNVVRAHHGLPPFPPTASGDTVRRYVSSVLPSLPVKAAHVFLKSNNPQTLSPALKVFQEDLSPLVHRE